MAAFKKKPVPVPPPSENPTSLFLLLEWFKGKMEDLPNKADHKALKDAVDRIKPGGGGGTTPDPDPEISPELATLVRDIVGLADSLAKVV